MAESDVLAVAMRLWPQVRDAGTVQDPADLDRLLAAQGQPGAPGWDRGLRYTFACFLPGEASQVVLPTGERIEDDAAARFVGHLLVTRTLVGAGLAVDEGVARAIAEAHALTWIAAGYGGQPAVGLGLSLWLVALDPLADSDRPLPIDWAADVYNDMARWDPDERLFSHYDVRERALDWAVYASHDAGRRAGISRWTLIEALLRLDGGDRGRLALTQLSAAEDSGERAPAAAILERNRIAGLLRAWAAPRS